MQNVSLIFKFFEFGPKEFCCLNSNVQNKYKFIVLSYIYRYENVQTTTRRRRCEFRENLTIPRGR